jgi:hypothetical protein
MFPVLAPVHPYYPLHSSYKIILLIGIFDEVPGEGRE